MYRCDVCNRVKQESNHWFIVKLDPKVVFEVWFWADMNIEPVPYTFVDQPVAPMHICGEECLHKKLNEFLQSRSIVTKEVSQ